MIEASGVWDTLRELMASQQLAVLATQKDGQPYSNLVAFACTGDLKHIVFVTGRGTRKYDNVLVGNKVALLVDNRTNGMPDFDKGIAATALGAAEEAIGSEREELVKVYVSKHPMLAEFARSSSNALMKIQVHSYVVAHFSGVTSLQVMG